MAGPTPSWNTVPLFGTWRNYDGTLKSGSYKITSSVRVTNTTDDVIVPAGLVASGALNEKEATGGGKTYSLYVDVPASDDPDNDVQGWQLTVEVTFKDSPGERYIVNTPLSAANNAPPGLNLRKVILPQTLPAPQPVLIKGVPGGLAVYDNDGDVVDAAGNKVIGGGGTGGGAVSSSSITDATVVGKGVLTAVNAASALSILGAKPSTYVPAWAEITNKPTLFPPDKSGLTKTDVGLGNVDNTPDSAKPVSAATQAALNGKAALSHTHVAADVSGVVKTVNGSAPDGAGNVTIAAGGVSGPVMYWSTDPNTRPAAAGSNVVAFLVPGATQPPAMAPTDIWFSSLTQ